MYHSVRLGASLFVYLQGEIKLVKLYYTVYYCLNLHTYNLLKVTEITWSLVTYLMIMLGIRACLQQALHNPLVLKGY